ncbi:MAG TPA: hypothetical protein VNT26_00790, partial [Candidatus Sulfotelmatobacter sp.]|nr:hypothetical protein [Candidatus Sulfotelmatobacter sp.]
GVDGRSLVGVIRSAEAASPHDVVHWHVGGRNGQWAVREGDWKLIGNAWDTSAGERKTERIGLFLANLAEDPGETRNRAGEKPKVVERLKRLHEEWAEAARSKGK